MTRMLVLLVAAIASASLVLAGCGQAPPAPTPTKAPAAPAATSPAVAPTAVATKPAAAPTAAPTKPAAAPTAVATKPAAAAPTAAPAKKVDYPQKGRNITMIVPFAAGGSTDVGARLLAPLMEKEVGVPVEVVNKAGASTQLATTELAAARPDGYTLSFVSLATVAVTYLDADRKATYGRKDLQPVANYTAEDNMIAVRAESPYKTAKDLADDAKARPDQVKVGDSGLMGNPHLGTIAFANQAGVRLAYVHFDGNAPASTALLGGHIDGLAVSTVAILPHFKSGAMRVLGIMGSQESKFFPGVKTFEAQGYKVHAPVTYGLVVPAATPREIVDILSASVKKALDTDDLRKKLEDAGLTPSYMNPEQYAAHWTQRETDVKPLLELAKKETK